MREFLRDLKLAWKTFQIFRAENILRMFRGIMSLIKLKYFACNWKLCSGYKPAVLDRTATYYRDCKLVTQELNGLCFST